MEKSASRLVFDMAEELSEKEHQSLIVALAASHAAKYGRAALPEKAQGWLARHPYVWGAVSAILGMVAAASLTGCTYSQSQTGKDGTTSTRIFALDAGTARDLIKLYGIPEVPSVKVQSTK